MKNESLITIFCLFIMGASIMTAATVAYKRYQIKKQVSAEIRIMSEQVESVYCELLHGAIK